MAQHWGARRRTVYVASAIALALMVVGRPCSASANEPDLEKIGALNTQAQESFSNKQYVAAAESWVDLFNLLPDTPQWQYQRAFVTQQTFAAYREAFNETKDIEHLREARKYLLRYISLIDPKTDPDAAAQAEQDLAVLDSQLVAYDQVVAAGDAEVRARRLQEEERNEFDGGSSRRPSRGSSGPSGRPLLIAGGVSTGLGVALLGIMAVGLAQGSSATRDGNEFIDNGGDPADPMVGELIDKGERADTLALVGGIVGGLTTTTGIVLLGIGGARARRNASRSLSLHPGVGRVSLTLRF